MPPIRGCGSWPVVSIILALFFVSAVHSTNITSPSCKTKFNSTLKITVIPDPHRVRRADKPLIGSPSNIAPRCNARFNSTVKVTEIPDGGSKNGTVPKVGHIRRSDSADSGIEHSESSGNEDPIDYPDYVDQGYDFAPYLQRSDEEVTAALVAAHYFDPGDQLASRFTDFSEFRNSGWNMRDETAQLRQDFNKHAAFGTALRSLRISDKARPEGKHEYTLYEHTLQWMDVSQSREPVGGQARFGFITDPEDACLIISVAYSTQYWIDLHDLDQQFGTISPPLSHQSDMAFLDWNRACTEHDVNPKNLKHIFLSVITTPETQQVVDHVFAETMGRSLNSVADLPLWDKRMTLMPETDEFEALVATAQVKGIVWMLLQHREHLGKKTIKQISVFKDEITGVGMGNEPIRRGPSFYIELEDVQSGGAQSGGAQSGGAQSGGAQSGGAQSPGVQSAGVQSARLRRADSSSGGTSEESGSSQSDGSNESKGSNGRAPLPPLNAAHLAPYIRHGEVAAAYMRASDQGITADLVRKRVFEPGQKLASPFTDHSAFKSSGWEEWDALDLIQGTAFDTYVPFSAALQSLGVSNKPQPEGKLGYTTYEHRLPWKRNGQTMNPVGRRATFQYATTAEDACIIMTMMYTTEYIIRDEGLIGIESPPLSHSSDIAFLEWKRACGKSQTDVKSLKHIFISVIVTPSTQDVVATVLKNMGKTITDRADFWANQLPGWEQKLTFQSDSDGGKALYGTVQLKGIMWMLVQHREHLGQKAIKSVSVFRGGDSPGERVYGPTFYIELEDVQSVDVQPAAGQSEAGQPGAKQQSGAGLSGARQLRPKL